MAFISRTYNRISGRDALLFIALDVLAFFIVLVVYRLWFHPSAKFPGDKIAGMTKWYEFYYDVVKKGGGQYTYKVEEAHRKYGPVVRINPDEIHVSDPEWYEVLYTSRGKRDKYEPAAKMAGTPLGTFGTAEHELHRRRRHVIAPLFSKRSINHMVPIIRDQTDKLCNSLESLSLSSASGIVELRPRYLAFATDIICAAILKAAPHPPLLSDKQSQDEWFATILAVEHLTPLVKQCSWLLPIAMKLPVGLFRRTLPTLARVLALHQQMEQIAQEQRATFDGNQDGNQKHATGNALPSSIFEAIYRSNEDVFEKSNERVAQEGLVVIGAGGETVSRVLSCATFHILDNPGTLARLTEELDGAFEKRSNVQFDLKKLEELVWLVSKHVLIRRLPAAYTFF
ncbi:MAG: hypothetical protein Q9162_006427 [Coniocarpon cinnabarinum]